MAQGEVVSVQIDPSLGFHPKNILALWSPQLVEARVASMIGNNGLPPEVAERVLAGEKGRLLGLAPYHKFMYADTLKQAQQAGVDTSYQAEIGPSAATHVVLLSPPPTKYRAVDLDPVIVRVAQSNLMGLKEAGAIAEDVDWEVKQVGAIDWNHEGQAPIVWNELVIQYGGFSVVDACLNIVKKDGLVGAGDVGHGVTEHTGEEARAFIKGENSLHVSTAKHQDLHGDTHFSWVPVGEAVEGVNGNNRVWFVPAQFTPDEEYYSGEGRALIQSADNKSAGWVTLVEKKVTVQIEGEGKKEITKYYSFGWALMPKQRTTQEDIDKLINQGITAEEIVKVRADMKDVGEIEALQRTLIDVYHYTDGWDGNTIYAIPSYIERESLNSGNLVYCAVEFNTFNDGVDGRSDSISAALPLSIIRRHGQQIQGAWQVGALRDVGEGKTFATPKELDEAIGRWTSPEGQKRLNEIIDYANPPVVKATLTKDSDVFQRICQAKTA